MLSYNWEPIYWESLICDEQKFWEYVKENPMPKSKIYKSPEEVLDDIKNATGVITLPLYENSDFIGWFEGLIEHLL